ncbi:MAG: ribonuclease J [Candidatus Shapirobacteria bacterium]
MDKLRIIALGEFSRVTGNLFAYHYLPNGQEQNDQILLVDCGLSFVQEDNPEVECLGPDISYLEQRKEKILGLVLTHGHEDHIGSLASALPKIGPFPIWATKLTAALCNSRLEESNVNASFRLINTSESFSLGCFDLTPIRVTHSLPETHHFFIKTPVGNFYHGADFKFDLTPPDGIKPELAKIGQLCREPVLALLSDCLGAEKKGYSPSESVLNEMFEQEIGKAKGRVFVTAISSNFYRWQKAIEASIKTGRKIAMVGYSIRKNLQIARSLGYLHLGKNTIIDERRIKRIPDQRLTVLIAGSLGQAGSSLDRVSIGEHRVKVKKGDKFIFSSPDYIPGTSAAIFQIINNLIEQGAEVVYEELGEELHVSGHGYQKELALLIGLTSPRFLLPIGGEWRHRRQYAKLAEKMGYSSERILLPKEGTFPTFTKGGLVDFNFKLSLQLRPLAG